MSRPSENRQLKESLQKQLDEITKLIEQDDLLKDIYLELGPYTPHLSDKLRYRLQDYFGFDDSE